LHAASQILSLHNSLRSGIGRAAIDHRKFPGEVAGRCLELKGAWAANRLLERGAITALLESVTLPVTYPEVVDCA
jgi:hypothetical protein